MRVKFRQRIQKKYLEACLEQCRNFSPFVVSSDGLLGKESHTLLNKRSALLERWEKPYSEICGYVNAPMSIAMVRATHLCLGLPNPNEPNEQPSSPMGIQSWTRAFLPITI
jgi:hypothetical protein